MDYKQKLVSMIESFNVKSVEEFKEAEFKIIADSKFRSMFKKKDYDGNIRMLRRVKKNVQSLDPKSVKVPEEDRKTTELKACFQKCMVVFNAVCDAYIQLQMALKNKAEGKALDYKEYKQIYQKVRVATASMNERMREMDIMYSDYAEIENTIESEDDYGGIKVMTYDSIR